MSPTITQVDLLLLGLLQDKPQHGYELYQHITHEGIPSWFTVSMAGVYYSLGKLRDRGLVSESRQKRTRGAGKAVYRLTDAGRAAFFEALEKQVAGELETRFEYDLGIYLINRLPLHRALELLGRRKTFLTEWNARIGAELEAAHEQRRPSHQIAILDHTAQFAQMELTWLEGVIESIQDTPADATAGRAGGLMELSGTLQDFHLPDLIRLVVAGRQSGILALTNGLVTRKIAFRAGQLCGATTSDRNDASTQSSPTADAVFDEIYDLFEWEEGEFSFSPSLNDLTPCIAIDLSAEQLILNGCRRVDNWKTIQQLVPSTETVFEVGMTQEKLSELTLDPGEQRVIEAMDGTRDMAAVANRLDLTLFEVSRAAYALAAVGALRPGDINRVRARRAFREIAELMCHSTLAWRVAPDDRTCESEVNKLCVDLPIRLEGGHISDQTDPNLQLNEVAEIYKAFLSAQIDVISRRFGRENARRSFERTTRQLVPELHAVAEKLGFTRLIDA